MHGQEPVTRFIEVTNGVEQATRAKHVSAPKSTLHSSRVTLSTASRNDGSPRASPRRAGKPIGPYPIAATSPRLVGG